MKTRTLEEPQALKPGDVVTITFDATVTNDLPVDVMCSGIRWEPVLSGDGIVQDPPEFGNAVLKRALREFLDEDEAIEELLQSMRDGRYG